MFERGRTGTMGYEDVLGSSKFMLCPEGAGAATYRVAESIAHGAIPVVVSSGYHMPFEDTHPSREWAVLYSAHDRCQQ